MNDQIKGLLITTLGVLIIVPDSLFVRLIDASPLTIAFWRSLIAGAVILAGLFFIQRTGAVSSIRKTGRSGLIYAGFMGASGIFFVVAVENTSIANVVFILASMPVFAALYSWIFLGEPIRLRMVLTIIGVVTGLAVIAFGAGQNTATNRFGDFLALCSAASFAGALTAARKARAVSMIPAIPLAYIGSAIVLWPFTDVLNVDPGQWRLIAAHGAVIIALSTMLLSLGPRYITSAEVSLLMLLEAVLAPLLAWFVLSEFPGRWTLTGGIIVISVLVTSNFAALIRSPSALTRHDGRS